MTPLVHLLLLNLSTYLLFAFDKSQSRSSSRRIPESVLLCLAFFGGGIGGYIAIRSLRHKSLNGRFVWVYRIGVVVTIYLMIKLWAIEDVWGVVGWGFCGIQAGIGWTLLDAYFH